MDWSADFPSDARIKNMGIGLEMINRWLEDVLQIGITNFGFTIENIEPIASRLIDAQLPNVAKILRQLPALDLADLHWEETIQRKLSYILLLKRCMERWESWDTIQQLSLLQHMGYALRSKTIVSKPGKTDVIWIYAVEVTIEENLKTRKSFAYALGSRDYIGILEYVFGRSEFDYEMSSNSFLEAQIHQYPHPVPWRVQLSSSKSTIIQSVENIKAYIHIAALREEFAKLVVYQPWLSEWSCALENMQLVYNKEQLMLIDLHSRCAQVYGLTKYEELELVSFALQQKISVVGTWKQNAFCIQVAIRGDVFWFLN